MLFEIYRDGKRLMHTENERLIPPADQLKRMEAAGCQLLLNGKRHKPKTPKVSSRRNKK